MPSMANITVLNAAAANVVYSASTPSAGDRSPAVWTANALSPIAGNRPKFKLLTRDNAKGNGRFFEGGIVFPVVATISGQEVILAKVPLNITGTLPTNVDAAAVNDAFVQFGNLLVSVLVRASMAEGYAPT